jgi:hypothetical protein
LGLINIVRVHGGAIIRGRKGALNSAALLLGILIMFIVEGGDFLTSLDKVESWSRVSQLTEYSKDIYSRRSTSKLGPVKRLEAQQVVLAEIASDMQESSNHVSVENIENEDKKAAAISGIEMLQNQTKKLISLYLSKAPEKELQSAHSQFEAIVSVATVSLKDIADDNYTRHSFLRLKQLMEYGFFFPLGAAMFSLLAFYIAGAAYRSFRIKSVEALVMMVFAILVMLGQIPQGPLYIWEGLPATRLWLMANVSTPAVRAIEFGSMVAGLAMAVRMWLSLEKSPLAVDEEEPAV